jgi:predicted nucleotidyltransferase
VGIDQTVINENIRRVPGVAAPTKINLFGSAANGPMTRDSDIDLLVIEQAPADLRDEMVRIGSALSGIGRPVDVIVMGAERFEETKDVIGGIAYPANKYGKVIYEDA